MRRTGVVEQKVTLRRPTMPCAWRWVRRAAGIGLSPWCRDVAIDWRPTCAGGAGSITRVALPALHQGTVVPKRSQHSSWISVLRSSGCKVPGICSTEERFLFTQKPPSSWTQFFRITHISVDPISPPSRAPTLQFRAVQREIAGRQLIEYRRCSHCLACSTEQTGARKQSTLEHSARHDARRDSGIMNADGGSEANRSRQADRRIPISRQRRWLN